MNWMETFPKDGLGGLAVTSLLVGDYQLIPRKQAFLERKKRFL
jgi:hypothetical protein